MAAAMMLAIGLTGCGGGGESPNAGAVASKQDVTAASTASAASTPSKVGKLQRYQIDPAKVFVAGISSGGFAAVQMHVAHSSTFKGAAVYAGGVYWCAGVGGAASALVNCGGLTLPTNQASYNSTLIASEAYLDTQSSLGTIDPAANLRGQPVYLWSGTQDEVVNPLEMADLNSEYQHYGARVHFDNAFPAEHGWESPDGELACGTLGSPYMVRCSANGAVYDSVKTWLTMFLGPLKPRNNGKLSGALASFDQTEFGASANLSMSSTGSVFVPKSCAQGDKCGLVLALHGCLQEASLIGNRWVTEAGINEWADTNKLVVVYPDTTASSAPGPTNPNACFDWWGYSNQYDPNYAIKSGSQMSVLYAMVQRVTGRP
ncbi:prolyl oligopeptidase family serine peptidase [Caballeronia sp. ATUFL_M2_KS44]|uniref:extracellular catalytic domain type 2 short-chain-length polyhydroxyalkanoate depolymerase n=1 Tax=Caballeronia sp. ATUFL_M2_KS44 TaxID=2921767 RepID=UPI0020285D29|nr:prolyl oligopeptidase family serine peptidase [Caballeronia sp. ATUFL_M2_KS44]